MRKRGTALYAVLGLSLALNALGIWWGLPSRYGWAVDELHPSVILEGIQVRFSGDWHQPAYPPLHYYIVAASYLPVLATELVDPRSLEGLTLFFSLGRAISLAMGLGILLVVHRLGSELFDAGSGIAASLILATTAPFVYYAKMANLDVPLTFWAMLSLLFFVRLLRREELRDYLFFTLSAACAMGTKDQAFAFYVLPLSFLVVRRWRREGSLAEAFFDRRVLLSLGVGLLSLLAIHNLVFNFRGFVHHLEEILWARRHYGAFEPSISHQAGMLRQTVLHLGFSLGWPVALASLGGILLAIRDRSRTALPLWVLLSGLSYYLFFVAPVLSTWLRYALPLAAIASLFGGRFLARLWERGSGFRVLVAAALLYSLARAISVDVLLLEDSRYRVEDWLEENVEPGEVVGFMGPEYYLPRLQDFDSRRLRPTESVLERARPDFLVVNADYAARFDGGTREGELFSGLASGRTPYALVFRARSAPRWSLLDFEGILANMSKIGPPIEVYERVD